MASQPDYSNFNYSISILKKSHLCSTLVFEDIATNSFIDFNQYEFTPDGFQPQYDNLKLSEGKYHNRLLFEIKQVILL